MEENVTVLALGSTMPVWDVALPMPGSLSRQTSDRISEATGARLVPVDSDPTNSTSQSRVNTSESLEGTISSWDSGSVEDVALRFWNRPHLPQAPCTTLPVFHSPPAVARSYQARSLTEAPFAAELVSDFGDWDLLEAAAQPARRIGKMWCVGFSRSGGFITVNTPGTACRKHKWVSCSVRHGRKSVPHRGVYSIMRHTDMSIVQFVLTYPCGPTLYSWFSLLDGFDSVSADLRNRLMHTLNGNGKFDAIAGYSLAVARSLGEDPSDLGDVLDDDLSEGGDFDISDGSSCYEDLPPAVRVATLEDIKRAAPIGWEGVKAWDSFNKNSDATTARAWNYGHSMTDCAGPRDLALSEGPNFVTKLQPSDKKNGKGKKDKSQAKKVRDSMRQHKWLSGLNVEVAEAWVRSNRPDASSVPGATSYLRAYASRAPRSQFYPNGVEDTHVFMFQTYVFAVAAKAGNFDPMTRELIQCLLSRGNIEVNPGPSINAELNEGWRFQNTWALCECLDIIEARDANATVYIEDRRGFFGQYRTPLSVSPFKSNLCVTIIALDTVVNTSDALNFDYVIARDIRREDGEVSEAIGTITDAYRYSRNNQAYTISNRHFFTHDELFVHKGDFARLTCLGRYNFQRFVHNQPAVSLFAVSDFVSPEPRSRHRTVVSPNCYYDHTPECIAVVFKGEYITFSHNVFNTLLLATVGSTFEDALRGFLGRLKNTQNFDATRAPHLAAAIGHAGAVATDGIMTEFTRNRCVYRRAVSNLQGGFTKFFRINFLDGTSLASVLAGDEHVSWSTVAKTALIAYGFVGFSFRFAPFAADMAYYCLARAIGTTPGVSLTEALKTYFYPTRSVTDRLCDLAVQNPSLLQVFPYCQSFGREMHRCAALGFTYAESRYGALSKEVSRFTVPMPTMPRQVTALASDVTTIVSEAVGNVSSELAAYQAAFSRLYERLTTSKTLSLFGGAYMIVAPFVEESVRIFGLPLYFVEVLFQPWKIVPFLCIQTSADQCLSHAICNFILEPSCYTMSALSLRAGERVYLLGTFGQYASKQLKDGWSFTRIGQLPSIKQPRVRTLLPTNYPLSAHSDNLAAVENAMVNRHAMCVPGDTLLGRHHKQKMWNDVASQVGIVAPVSETTVAMAFDGSKRLMYLRESARMATEGLLDNTALESHLKRELCCHSFDESTGAASSAPRAIQANSLSLLLLQGTFVMPFTDRCLEVWGIGQNGRLRGTRFVIAVGATRVEVSDELQRLQSIGEPFVITNGDDGLAGLYENGIFMLKGTDSSRHDSHITRCDLLEGLRCYDNCGLQPHVSALWRKSFRRKGAFYKGAVKYAGDESTVNSGSRDTTIRNGFLNGDALVHHVNGKSLDWVYKNYGLKLKVASASSDFSHYSHEFCSGVLMPTLHGTAFCNKVGRLFSRLSYTLNDGDPSDLLHSKMDSAYCNLWNFPELQNIIKPLCMGFRNTSYTKPGMAEPASLLQRTAWFYARYSTDYAAFCDEVRTCISDYTHGTARTYHAIRAVAAVDYGDEPVDYAASYYPMDTDYGKPLVKSRGVAIAPAFPIWHDMVGFVLSGKKRNAIMHALFGNTGRSVLLLVGWLATLFLLNYPEQTLSYQRHKMHKASKQNKLQKKEVQALNKAMKEVKIAQKDLVSPKKRSKSVKKQRTASYIAAGDRVGAVAKIGRRSKVSDETATWFKSILDPFTYRGVHTCGTYHTRGIVPYVIKRSIQVASGNGNCSYVISPNLNNMVWNCDSSTAVLSFAGNDSWVQPTTAPTTTNGLPLDPVSLGPYSIGLSLPALSAAFQKFRIVSYGIKIKCDASYNNSGGKIAVCTLPYEGYLPYVSASTDATIGSQLPGIDAPIVNGSVFQDTSVPKIFSAHADSVVVRRPLTAANILDNIGLSTTASNIFQAVVNTPGSKVYAINETVGKEIMVSGLPCSSKVFDWRDTGNYSTAVSPGTASEAIFFNAGTDAYPGVIQLSSASAPLANIMLVSDGVDTSGIRSMGFETIVVAGSGIGTGQNASFDIELIYNIEALPNIRSAIACPGVIPADVSKARDTVPLHEANQMLQDVSAVDPIRVVAEAGAGINFGAIAATAAHVLPYVLPML